MSIASEITRINTNIANAYTACNTMGATMPASGSQNSANLATTIETISTGITPTGTYSITANGIYDISNYAYANVSISGGSSIGIAREVSNNTYKIPSGSITFSVPSSVTTIDKYALAYAFYGSAGLTSVDLSGVNTINDYGCYYGFAQTATTPRTALTSIDLSDITTIHQYGLGNAFRNNNSITTVDLSNLTSVGTNAMNSSFAYCKGIISINLSSLQSMSSESVFESCFMGCTSITTINLSGLTTVESKGAFKSAFSGCTSLSSISFPNLTTIGKDSSVTNYAQFASCFQGCTNLNSISFSNLTTIYCTGTSTATNGTFYGNNKVQKFYFPKLNTITYGSGATSTNQNACKYIFSGCDSLTEIHFGAANQSAIEASPGYSTAWGRGAGNVTIYFDL